MALSEHGGEVGDVDVFFADFVRNPERRRVGENMKANELLKRVDKLRQRTKTQAAIIGLLVRLVNLRGSKRSFGFF